MKIDKSILDTRTAEAKSSPRLRMNKDLRNTPEDTSQRMLNALEPGTELPVHRHPGTSETCVILRGSAEEILYDGQGKETERILLTPSSDCVGINIPAGQWHKIVSLEPGTIILEAKDGAYTPLSQEDILEK